MKPTLIVQDAGAALDFYARAFGAVETLRFGDASRIAHAELRLGDSVFAVADESPEWRKLSPARLGGTPVILAIDVADADAAFARALAAGAVAVFPPADQDHGHRQGRLVDPFGHMWLVSAPLAAPAR